MFTAEPAPAQSNDTPQSAGLWMTWATSTDVDAVEAVLRADDAPDIATITAFRQIINLEGVTPIGSGVSRRVNDPEALKAMMTFASEISSSADYFLSAIVKIEAERSRGESTISPANLHSAIALHLKEGGRDRELLRVGAIKGGHLTDEAFKSMRRYRSPLILRELLRSGRQTDAQDQATIKKLAKTKNGIQALDIRAAGAVTIAIQNAPNADVAHALAEKICRYIDHTHPDSSATRQETASIITAQVAGLEIEELTRHCTGETSAGVRPTALLLSVAHFGGEQESVRKAAQELFNNGALKPICGLGSHSLRTEQYNQMILDLLIDHIRTTTPINASAMRSVLWEFTRYGEHYQKGYVSDSYVRIAEARLMRGEAGVTPQLTDRIECGMWATLIAHADYVGRPELTDRLFKLCCEAGRSQVDLLLNWFGSRDADLKRRLSKTADAFFRDTDVH